MFLTRHAPSSSCQVLVHFDGNLVVVPIVYNFEAQRAHIKQAYGQVKKRNVPPPGGLSSGFQAGCKAPHYLKRVVFSCNHATQHIITPSPREGFRLHNTVPAAKRQRRCLSEGFPMACTAVAFPPSIVEAEE